MYAKITIVALALLLVPPATNSALSAAEAFDPAARAEAVAPYLDAQTIAVCHLDLARIDVDRLLDTALELIPEADYQIDLSRDALVGAREGLAEAGVTEIYMVFSLADLPRQPPFFILPAGRDTDVNAVRQVWPQLRGLRYYRDSKQVIEPLGGAIFVGNDRTFERVKRVGPHARPGLADAFGAARDTAVQFLLLPTADHRRVIDEMLPVLPEEVGGGPSAVLTRGLIWAAVGLNVPPTLSLEITVQSADNGAARAFAERLAASVGPLAEHAKSTGMLREVDKAVAALTPRVVGDRLHLVLDQDSRAIETFMTAITPPLEEARAQAARSTGINNLKQLGLAMHNWHDTYKSFPAPANFDATGKPLLSWRVHILPFVDEMKLYDQFHLDEPWDSPHNSNLIEQMPEVYRSPLSKKSRQGYTAYVRPMHEETVCPSHRGIPFKEISDGTSNTIMIVEVGDDRAVIWTKPADLPVDLKNPAEGMGGLFKEGFQAAYCDGSVRFIPSSVDRKTLRALLTRAGGEAVDPF